MTGAMAEITQDIIGNGLLAGKTAADAITDAGYARNTALYHSTKVLKQVKINEWLENWRENHAQKQIEALAQGNCSGEQLKKAQADIDAVDKPEVRARLRMEYAKITSSRSQDLLDRAGVSKISKSMRITGKVNLGDIRDVQTRIQAIKAKIDGKPAVIKGKVKAVVSQAGGSGPDVHGLTQDSGQAGQGIPDVGQGVTDATTCKLEASQGMQDVQSQGVISDDIVTGTQDIAIQDSHSISQDAAEALTADLKNVGGGVSERGTIPPPISTDFIKGGP